METVANCFSQTIITNPFYNENKQLSVSDKLEVCLVTFEGKIFKYCLKENNFLKNEKHIKNYIPKEIYDNYMTNPAYVSSVHYDYTNNLIVIGLLNGVVITFKAGSLKNHSIKSCHDASVVKVISSNFNSENQFSLGKDNKIVILRDYSKIIKYIDLSDIYDSKVKNHEKEKNIKSKNAIYPTDMISTINNQLIVTDNSGESIKVFNLHI